MLLHEFDEVMHGHRRWPFTLLAGPTDQRALFNDTAFGSEVSPEGPRLTAEFSDRRAHPVLEPPPQTWTGAPVRSNGWFGLERQSITEP